MSYVRLGDAARFINGAAFKPSDWADDGLPIVRIQNLTGTGETFNRTNRIVRAELIVEPGDLLVSWSATLDAYRWNGPRGVLNQHIFKVLPKDGVRADYLYYALREVISELERKTHGSTMKHVVRGDFESTRVPLPSLAEQDRIVDLLSRAENIVRMRREAEAKAKEIIPALFRSSFGDIGSDSNSYPLLSLGEICDRITDGTHKTPKYVSAGIPFVTVKNITSGSVDFTDTKFISREEHLELVKRTAPRRGDVLVSKDGTIGVPCLVDTDREFSVFVSVALLKLKTSLVDPEFLAAQIATPWIQAQIKEGTKGAAIRHLHLKDFRSLRCILPPITVQQKFARRVKYVKQLHRSQLTTTKNAECIFQSLLAGVFQQ